jgi:hypothetical protein
MSNEVSTVTPEYDSTIERLNVLTVLQDIPLKTVTTHRTIPLPEKPKIVCMCGSTKFKQTWINENSRLTREGFIVLSVGLWGHHERVFPDAETKFKLDELHKRKIDLCDWVWILDVGGYIGESTRSEITYANKLGKPIFYLSETFPDYLEPEDPLMIDYQNLLSRCQVLQQIIDDQLSR